MAGELDNFTLLRAQKNEPSACKALVTIYQKPVTALLWRMMTSQGKQQLVEDLVQETFLRVFRSLGSFQPEGSARLSTWILTIATRLALNELRRKSREEPLSPSYAEQQSSAQADELLRQRLLAQALERAIASLQPEYRAVFLLSEYHQCSQQDIAEMLTIPSGTVKSRLSRARKHMKEQLREHLP
jgi:RNA polymerase sigma-70 factor (ECF subfamily)